MPRWLLEFELKIFSPGNFTNKVFQSSLGLLLLNGGLAKKCILPSKVRKTKEVLILLFYEKRAQVVVRFRAQRLLSRQFQEKCFPISSWTFSTGLRTGGGEYPS